MLGDAPVIDAVVHGFDTSRAKHSAEEVLWTCFAESATDIAVFHAAPRRGVDDAHRSSPWEVGLHLRELAGEARVWVMASLTDPFDTALSVDELDEMVEVHGVCGLQLYPWAWDARHGRLRQFPLGDEDVALPLIEHARRRGLDAITIHDASCTADDASAPGVERAIAAFPDVHFEVVVTGEAVEDEIPTLVSAPNVYVSLERATGLLAVAPRRFAMFLASLLDVDGGRTGVEDRILWASGLMAVHPQSLLERFWHFEMPRDLREQRGLPELTPGIKRKILAANFARKNGVDLDAALAAIPNDHMRQAQMAGDYAAPWSRVRRNALINRDDVTHEPLEARA